MVEQYDPNAFAIRVSERLFHVLSGRAVEPGPIEPRTRREAALVDSLRKEAQRDRQQLVNTLKQDALKDSHQREQVVQNALSESCSKLDAQLRSLDFPSAQDTASLPCQSLRDAVAECYRRNGADNILLCAQDVAAFSECAKQLCSLSSK